MRDLRCMLGRHDMRTNSDLAERVRIATGLALQGRVLTIFIGDVRFMMIDARSCIRCGTNEVHYLPQPGEMDDVETPGGRGAGISRVREGSPDSAQIEALSSQLVGFGDEVPERLRRMALGDPPTYASFGYRKPPVPPTRRKDQDDE